MLKLLDKATPLFVGFIQSFFLSCYLLLVGTVMSKIEKLFGNKPDSEIVAPLMFLTFFIVSALISTTIVLGYPFYTFWIKKNFKKAFSILFSTILFLTLFFISYIYLLSRFI